MTLKFSQLSFPGMPRTRGHLALPHKKFATPGRWKELRPPKLAQCSFKRSFCPIKLLALFRELDWSGALGELCKRQLCWPQTFGLKASFPGFASFRKQDVFARSDCRFQQDVSTRRPKLQLLKFLRLESYESDMCLQGLGDLLAALKKATQSRRLTSGFGGMMWWWLLWYPKSKIRSPANKTSFCAAEARKVSTTGKPGESAVWLDGRSCRFLASPGRFLVFVQTTATSSAESSSFQL